MAEPTPPDKKYVENYLSLFKIANNKYIIGVFHPGITVYKQQIRALNIFHALVETGKINPADPNLRIGVIGAGVAGLTFAAAAAKIGVKVTLFEKRAIYMPMQYGCDTRIIHPNIYDWPANRSAFPYAEVPILQWRAGTASSIAKQMVNGFLSIKQESSDILCLLDTEIIKIEDLADGEIKIRHKKGSDILNCSVNLLIYAIGYGVEKGVDSAAKTPSYWRNDDYAQPILSRKVKHYFISGIGDGGLLDLFRLKIRGFSIEAMLQEISCYAAYSVLIEEINKIKEEWKALEHEQKSKKNWLHEQFEKIGKELYNPILEKYFLPRIIRNCIVTVHGKETEFADNLSLDKISMLNAFIVFIISRNTDFFTYKKGVFDNKSGYYALNGKKVNGTVIIRQGTNRMGFFKEKGLLTGREKKQVATLEKEQKKDKFFNTTNLLFPYSSLNSLLNKSPQKKFAFLTPETTSICSSFVAVLSNALKFHQLNKFRGKKYRVCLHRVLKDGYQQVTPYYGDTEISASMSIGSVHSLDKGIVGLSIKSGRPVLVQNNNQEDFERLITRLNLDPKYKVYGNSAIAIPVLAYAKRRDLCVNLVCFMESDDKDFFSNPDLSRLIVYAIEGFMNYINTSLDKQIKMTEIDFAPLKISDTFGYNGLTMNPCFVNICEKFGLLCPDNTTLKFTLYNSFDITYIETVDYLHLYPDAS